MHLLPKKGSVLVFSLIVLSIILSAAITVATVSVTNQRSASSTGKSVQSFQVADSGIELALQKIYKGSYTDLNAMATGMGGGASCAGGAISKNNVVGGAIKVSFYDNDGNLVACTATDWRDKVVRIKSEGSAFGTTRVVETAVAAAHVYPKITDYTIPGGFTTVDLGIHDFCYMGSYLFMSAWNRFQVTHDASHHWWAQGQGNAGDSTAICVDYP